MNVPFNRSFSDIRVDWEVYNENPSPKKLIDFIVCYGRAFPPRDKFGNEIIAVEKSGKALNWLNINYELHSLYMAFLFPYKVQLFVSD